MEAKVPPKRLVSQDVHGAKSLKTAFFTVCLPNNIIPAQIFCSIRGEVRSSSIARGLPENCTYAAALKERGGEFISV
jgi:hypothetical protein